MRFTFGSLFAGIGGLDLGLEKSGMVCQWQGEIDGPATGVLERHWPAVERFGDVRDCGAHNLAPVDLIAGGFPCQDVSVAGRRKGLAGERSGLWFEFHRILAELAPRWVVIENVPGLLSSRKGRDFAVILRGLAELGYLSAWRILDAQYFGVAQRRRRVFIVGHLGDGRAAEVLFERTSSAWDPPPSREAGTGVTAPVKASTPSRRCGGSWPIAEEFVIGLDRTRGTISGDVAGTLRANSAQAPGVNDGKADNQCVAYTIQTNDGGDHKRKDRPEGGMYVKQADQALTLGSSDQTVIAWDNAQGDPNADEDGTAFALNPQMNQGVAHALSTRPGERLSTEDDYVLAFQAKASADQSMNPSPMAPTLDQAKAGGTSVLAFRQRHYEQKKSGGKLQEDVAHPVLATEHHGGDMSQRLLSSFGVRRLTLVECERLQGFPDNWTAGQSDSRRYKQLGNAVCVPVAEWIGRAILTTLQR